MAINAGPKIVEDGLVFCVDAANRRSYPRAGTVWTDLATSKVNGTLTNMTDNFSTDGVGTLTFDGADEHVNFGDNFSFLDDPDANEFTITSWINGEAGADGTIFSKADNGNRMVQLYTETSDIAVIKVGGTAINGTIIVTDGTWHNVGLRVRNDGGTYKGRIYVDGVSDSSESAIGSTTVTADFIIGARRNSGNTGLGYLFNGKIANCFMYNRALSSAEILQNYNATKWRFQ
jgi:hypothetical protein